MSHTRGDTFRTTNTIVYSEVAFRVCPGQLGKQIAFRWAPWQRCQPVMRPSYFGNTLATRTFGVFGVNRQGGPRGIDRINGKSVEKQCLV